MNDLAITVTDNAQQHFSGLIEKEGVSGMNLRLFVANPGTIHADISLTFCPPKEEENSDLPLHLNAFTLFMAKDSVSYLKDAVIDFVSDELGAGHLSIKAPFLKGEGFDTEAPLEARIQFIIDNEINPNLASHGGRVHLVAIEDDNALENPGKIVILQFGGGCHGCGMAGVTLKQGIEKTLKEHFPEIVEIRDVTDHTTGTNPYC